ncbi:Transient receptor potential cation channel subfamily A member 1 [Paramuricea clavata]|uniref:Transient receptor potential cation channel subfamily A member 1 n=1 Tax=Paramuricea clavata TaxID=317549 RepID=A0A6S7LS06_PARCT|nr:Transient receptor potential cation channel subfamily A member 1 [Paramuricea clavata]
MGEKEQKIQGLLAVLDMLKSNYVAEDGKEYDCSFLAFDEAAEIFFAFQNKAPPFINTDKNSFTYSLLHAEFGLCVYIIYVKSLNNTFVVLRPDSFGIEVFLDMICAEVKNNTEKTDIDADLDVDKVQGIPSTVDTEWDRKGVRVILAANRSRSQMNKLGIDADNSDDEEFVAKSIEDKSTNHGRRHDLVMYTNRRVKKRDLLNIANYRLARKNKKMIKSATTVYNRSKPRSLRSIQAKKHTGKGLFCTKNPPKAEDIDNENAHYQRADEGEEKLVTEEDSHFVFVRPKAIVGSSGSTWASETIRLRQRHPDLFEVKSTASGESYSVQFRQTCAVVHNDCFLYQGGRELESSLTVSETIECEAEKQVFQKMIQTKIIGAKEKIEKCFQDVPTCEEFHQSIQDVTICCEDILMIIKDLQLPTVKPRWCDLTDAGPGVGVSNFEVKFRDAEICRMFSSDYRIRLHRSRGDSGQGEAERTNSAIGDSVVDGSTIEWEQFKKF